MRRRTRQRLVASGLGAVAFAVIVLVVVLPLASDRDTTNLGPEVFRELEAAELADRIADGGPRAYASLAGADRPIWVQHEGDDADTGWTVVAAIVPGTDCVVDYDFDDEVFRDCEGTSYGPAGAGLPTYPSEVVDGVLVIDLNADAAP